MATHKATNTTIKPGDRVSITALGRTIEGIVSYADCEMFKATPDWMIEFKSDDGTPHYWKQRFDGGVVRLVN